MGDLRKIKLLLRTHLNNLQVSSGADTDERIMNDALAVMEQSKKARPALAGLNVRRMIMKSPITKLAAAAVIVVAVVLGLFEFIGGGGDRSGVVWAEVARKVQASGSLVVRLTESGSVSLVESDYAIKYFSPLGSRTDVYRDGQVALSRCTNAETKTTTVVMHDVKRYYSYQRDEGIEEFLEKDEDWTNPIYLVQTILSVEHTELGEKTVDGILCEGLKRVIRL